MSITSLRRRKALLVIASSTQAAADNPYGLSKRQAEAHGRAYGAATGAPVHVFRLPNVFGKWCRPNYNSVVATFCHNIARDLQTRSQNRIQFTVERVSSLGCGRAGKRAFIDQRLDISRY
mgnify:CR=1 FL=1